MTKLDYIVIVLLLGSALVGFVRGAVREVVAMTALLVAAAAAVLGWKLVRAPIAQVIHTPWIAAVLALLLVFVIVDAALRLGGAGLARRIQRADVLGGLDRTIGLLIGLVRGLVVLGVLYLMFNATTPADLRPRWILEARTWPLAADMARFLERLAPQGLDLAGRLKPAFARAVDGGSGDRNATEGYDPRQRSELDDLVERSR